MKKIKNVIMIIVILISICDVSLAHGGNITGWKDKNSKKITEYNGKYYGYHKEDGVIHYHQVKWDEEKQKWTKNNKLGIWSDETNNIQNNENNTIEGNKTDIEDNNILYMIMSITIVLIISILNITHNTKKRK